ncbi:MAG TPA: YfiR family protein [Burkholderiales bacterium]|nr:YfiR family protein [Burkholderiales bacterium]
MDDRSARYRAPAANIWSAVARFALLALCALCAGESLAADESPQDIEQRVKAAFLFKFGGYVEWPERVFPRSDSPLVLGVAGADVLAAELSRIASGRTMNGRPVVVRRVRGGEQVTDVHVLFIGRSEASRLGELLSMTQGQPVLTVSETEKGLAQGSVINFVIADNRVRFEVSLETANRNGLRIGAPLLAVAQRVQEKAQ